MRFILILLFPLSLFSYEYNLTILAIFQNEAPYLKEWIDYHLKVGVEHFVLYNHYSDDNYQEVLSPYVQSGVVELRNCTMREFPKVQILSYREGIYIEKNRSKWLALIDIDEFIVPKVHNTITSFLQNYEYQTVAGLVVNWQLFGTSGIKSLNGISLLRNLTWKFPSYFDSDWSSNKFIKSIIRPDRIDENSSDYHCGNHVFMPLQGYYLVNSNHNRQYVVCKIDTVTIDQIQLNHYWFRDEDWFYEYKIRRREGVGEKYPQSLINWLFYMGHQEQDFSIHRFLTN